MEQKQNIVVIGLLTLILGLLLGYFLGANRGTFGPNFSAMNEMHESMEQYHDEISAGDESMQRAMDEMMFGLEGKTGAAFEEAFLRGMIVHHLGAIDMAQDLLKNTERPELIEMANNIISVQTEEVATMKKWLEEWF